MQSIENKVVGTEILENMENKRGNKDTLRALANSLPFAQKLVLLRELALNTDLGVTKMNVHYPSVGIKY